MDEKKKEISFIKQYSAAGLRQKLQA